MNYRTINVNGLNIFYRECGASDKPVMVLFHGFPSASHQFRDLINELGAEFRIIAPDYPGFGQSDIPSRKDFTYTFDHIADITDKFLQQKGVGKFYMYVFDYGAPIGFRIATKHPGNVLGIISQNGNVYAEGLGKKWEARAEYWKNPVPLIATSTTAARATTSLGIS